MNLSPPFGKPSEGMAFLDGAEQEQRNAAEALGRVLAGKSARPADWAMDPNQVFICPNGHIQYNLPPEEIAEMVARGQNPKHPPCYDGAPCRIKSCTEPISLLTADPKRLQHKLSTAMERCAQLGAMLEPLQANEADRNRITEFLKANYGYEIDSGQRQHDGQLSKAVIHYLRIERGRFWGVIVPRFCRAVMQMMGAR